MKILSGIGFLLCIVFAPAFALVENTPPPPGKGGKFTASPATIVIGDIPVGGRGTDTIVVTNTGDASLKITSVTSSNPRFTVSPPNVTIAESKSSKFIVAFSPTSTGTQTAYIIFKHDGENSPDTVRASGATTVPGFTLNRKVVSFGLVPLGGVRIDSVTVTNTGTAALVIATVASGNSAFLVNQAGVTLQPAQTKTFSITFTPLTTDPQSGSIVFTHNAAGVRDTVVVSGTGLGTAGYSVTRRTIAFGALPVGSSRLDSLIVTDTGNIPLVISNVASGNGTFTVSPANATLLPAQTRTFFITFNPVNTSPQSGSIVFTHNAPGASDTVTVSGAGTLPGFALNRKTVPFGLVLFGGDRLDSVIVTDTGKTALVISNVASSNWTFTVNPTNATIQPAQTRTFYLTFTPANTEPQSGSILFTHNAPNGHDTLIVSGTGVGGGGATPGFSLTRRNVPMGTTAIGTNKLDSVIITDTGDAPLVISNVASGNGAFSVSPANATLLPGQLKTFYIMFTPTNSALQSGSIVFTHNAASAHDTVTVSGTGTGGGGGTAGFAVTRRTVDFGNVSLGGNRLDSVSVTDTGGVALVISNVASSNGAFAVNPASATIQPAQTRTFYITFTPINTIPQTGSLVFTQNTPGIRDTVALLGSSTVVSTPLPAPALVGPLNGSVGKPSTVSLYWNSVPGATGYWLEMATDPSFTSIVISDPTLVATGRQVSGLAPNTQYYWRVSTRSASIGSGPFSSAWTLTTLSLGLISGTVSFSGELNSTSYKMFGLPGVGTRRVADILAGAQMTDWRIIWDNGKDTTYPAYYEDLNAGSLLSAGTGYWLLQRRDLSISRTDTLPPLATDGTYGITLHSGWNMISNPFMLSVQRDAVTAANGLPAGTFFWEQVGGTRTSSGTTFEPFKAYYFDNDTPPLATLKFPYPFGLNVAKRANTPDVDWRVELVFDSDINKDRDNYVGIAPGAKPGLNELNQHEAPLVFDQGFLYFVRPEWDPVHTRFTTDMRANLGTGQTWDFEVWNPRRGPGKITLLGLEGIPAGNEVVLIDALNTTPVDMRRTHAYSYNSSSKKMQFKLFIGTKGYVESETSKLIPQTFELAQNYPNPFNPSTTIPVALPFTSGIELKIYTILGEEVRNVYSGILNAGRYSFMWDGRNNAGNPVASGIYLSRLSTTGGNQFTRNMLLMK